MSTKDTNRRIENSALILAASTPSRPRTAADAMFQAGMSSDECSNKNLQKRVHRKRMEIKKKLGNPQQVLSLLLSNQIEPAASTSPVQQPHPTTTVSMSAVKKAANTVKCRMTSRQAQLARQSHARKTKEYQNALKAGSLEYDQELQKTQEAKKEGKVYKIKSAATISRELKQSTGISVHERTIRNHVKQGKAGETPTKRGTKGTIPEKAYKALCGAFESYVKLSAANREPELSRDPLMNRVNSCVNKMPGEHRKRPKLLERVQKDLALTLGLAPPDKKRK